MPTGHHTNPPAHNPNQRGKLQATSAMPTWAHASKHAAMEPSCREAVKDGVSLGADVSAPLLHLSVLCADGDMDASARALLLLACNHRCSPIQ